MKSEIYFLKGIRAKSFVAFCDVNTSGKPTKTQINQVPQFDAFQKDKFVNVCKCTISSNQAKDPLLQISMMHHPDLEKFCQKAQTPHVKGADEKDLRQKYRQEK